MNACDAVQDLLTAHLLSALDKSEEALVRDHLGACAPCRSAKAETEACVAYLEAPPVAAPAKVWTNIRSKIDREGAGDPVRDTDPSPVISLSCSFCRGGMTRTAAVYCASCLAPHHPECFQEHGRCSVMGCAESRIVRPSELPPLQIHEGGKEPPRPRRLRRWFLGGLSLIALGAGAAALNQGDPPEVLRPDWEVRPALDLRTNYRLEAEQATLAEICAAIQKLPGTPSVSLPSECRELLVRRVSIEGVHWSEALGKIVAEFGLKVVEDGKGWRIDRTAAFEVADLERAQGDLLELDTTRIVDLDPTSESDARIHMGWNHSVHVAPGARSLAVLDGRKLLLFRGTEKKGEAALDAPCCDVSWSPEGSRLAYVAGESGSDAGQLGVFDLSGDRFGHTLVRKFPGIDEDARLAWCEGSDQILLKTSTDLKQVSTMIGEQVFTLRAPSPNGYRRFDLMPLGGDRFLVLYPDGVEAWRIGRGSPAPLYPDRVAFPPGYRVLEPTRDGKAMVLTESTALLLDTTTGRYQPQEERGGLGAFHANVNASGTILAFLKQHEDSDFEELMLRPVAGGELRKLDPGRGVVLGFRWAPTGPLIAFWTEDSVFVETSDSRHGAPRNIQTYPETRVLDVQWLSLPGSKPGATSPALVVTTRGLAQRRAEVRVEEMAE